MLENKLAHIKLDSDEYHKLGLNDQITVFNHEVHNFEDEQQQKIVNLWQSINKDYLNKKLSQEREELIKQNFAQALANLTGMMQAKTLYEAQLYRRSYVEALERAKTPRRRFIWLQTRGLALAHDAEDIKPQFEHIQSELKALEQHYPAIHHPLFSRAKRELIELAQVTEPAMFNHKKTQFLNTLADIHGEVNQQTAEEKQCDEIIEEVVNRGQAIFDARSSYLDDKNNWMSQADNIAEKGWLGVGSGLAVAPIALLSIPVAVAAAPVVALGVGIAGAAYGAVDLSRSIASRATKETTVKLGEREVPKPTLTWREKLKALGKKAAPIALCTLGAVVATAAIVLTAGVAGVALAAVGVAVASSGVGMMAYNKYQEKNEIIALQAQHKKINKPFSVTQKPRQEDTQSLQPEPAPTAKFEDSMEESMSLLAEDHLTHEDIASMEKDLKAQIAASIAKPKAKPVPEEEDEEGGGESEVGETQTDETQAKDDEGEMPIPRP